MAKAKVSDERAKTLADEIKNLVDGVDKLDDELDLAEFVARAQKLAAAGDVAAKEMLRLAQMYRNLAYMARAILKTEGETS